MQAELRRKVNRERFFALLKCAKRLKGLGYPYSERIMYYLGWQRGHIDCYDTVNLILKEVQ